MEPTTEIAIENALDVVCLYEQAFRRQAPGETLRPGGLALTQHALTLCALPASARLLDAGCGAGSTVQYLREQGYSAWGMDLSPILLRAGRRRVPTLPVFQANAEALPLPAGQFDIILAECSLSVFAQPDRALAEFHRLLRAGGFLILTDLYVRNPSALAALQACLPSSCLARSFTREALFAQLDGSGFNLDAWEDHSEVLHSLAQPALSTLLQGAPTPGMDALDVALMIARVKPGYFLCLSRRR